MYLCLKPLNIQNFFNKQQIDGDYRHPKNKSDKNRFFKVRDRKTFVNLSPDYNFQGHLQERLKTNKQKDPIFNHVSQFLINQPACHLAEIEVRQKQNLVFLIKSWRARLHRVWSK